MEDKSCDTCMRECEGEAREDCVLDGGMKYWRPKVSTRFRGTRRDHEGFAAEPIHTGDNPDLARTEAPANQPLDDAMRKNADDALTMEEIEEVFKEKSDGSTASYYELPEGATELQDLISYKNMNAQIGEIIRACYRYGQVEHSEKMRDAKKIKFYIEAEIDRLEKYGEN